MKKPPKARADKLLVAQGLAESEQKAQALIMASRVLATDPDGKEYKIDKPGSALRTWVSLRIKGKVRPYVSRAGTKLEGALDTFEIDPSGWVCADIGLSTGGFTDCLLRRGAERVHGVDVSYGIVDWRIRTDPRLVLHERTNARHLAKNAFGEQVHLAVVDVSFISAAAILPAVCTQLTPDGALVILVKPQFEAARGDAPKGVVQDESVRQATVDKVVSAAEALGLELCGQVDSKLAGADGNRELLVHLRRTASAPNH